MAGMKRISILFFVLPSLAFANADQISRSAFRARILSETFTPPTSYSQSGANDQAANLVDDLKFQTLEEMDSQGLLTAAVAEHPWSSSYWPMYEGLLANRYGDRSFPSSANWKENATYIEQHLGNPGAGSVDILSPSEKYDLLVGDSSFTLTHSMLNEGQEYYDQYGTVESWMGICHGWSPAAYMVPRPEHVVRVLAADGKTWIQFFPADIKALASLLWAEGEAPMRSIGGRCDDANPAVDPSGRPTNPDCLDTNPGTWHLSVVNQIGVSKRSFVMDAEWTAQVWNQPIYSYSYSYYNPKTKQSVQKLSDAQVEMASFPEDPLRTVRASAAVALVGISMNVTYTVESWPTQAQTDSPALDPMRTVHYQYDVELDESGKIIGGEWHEKAHPDFLWTPAPGAVAKSVGDISLDRDGDQQTWNGTSTLPKAWRAVARRASADRQPLERVVDTLVGLAR